MRFAHHTRDTRKRAFTSAYVRLEIDTKAIHDERSKAETGAHNRKKSNNTTPDYSDGETPTPHP